jgi:hypothetical protein
MNSKIPRPNPKKLLTISDNDCKVNYLQLKPKAAASTIKLKSSPKGEGFLPFPE